MNGLDVRLSVYLQITAGPSCERDGWRWELRWKDGDQRQLRRSEEVFATRAEAVGDGSAVLLGLLGVLKDVP